MNTFKFAHTLKGAVLTPIIALAGVLVVSIPAASAGEADVVGVEAMQSDSGWRFNVTVRHGDEGWDHYANKWDIVGPDGTVYGTRELLHPHETEQPFTRSLSGVEIPEGIEEVEVRAHDSVHGYGGETFKVQLKR